MDNKFIIYEKNDGIATIIFNNPDKLNSWDFPTQGGMTDEFYSTLGMAEQDDEIKVIIIKGAGKSFSTGHDLNTVGYIYGMGTGKSGERRASQRRRLQVDRGWLEDCHKRLFLCPKITIAQVHGHCIGEGTIMMLCCDLSVAAEDAMIGHTEQRLGFAGSGIGTINILIACIGLRRALELLILGKQIDGIEAERIGMVNKAVPQDKLDEEVMEIAKAVTLLPRDGIAIGKTHRQLAYNSLGLTEGFTQGYVTHTMFTNLRWEPDEYNFFKERRDKGTREGFHKRDERYQK
ncbi:MAG: enoyl-CoA hydratase/isomerase family protein [Spirochaetota bacterium]|nr:enoyl-CoA hydratase/isomerase family protein [Spirochaetota bacterium]